MTPDHRTTLQNGTRVRVRLPQAADRVAIHGLHERLGLITDDFDVVRELQFDPRRRLVVCATTWIGTSETLVGYGVIDLGAGEPSTVVCDEQIAPGLAPVLTETLRRTSAARSAA